MRRASIAVALVVCAWWLASNVHFTGRPLIAGPFATLYTLPRNGGVLMLDLARTLGRATVGFVLGSAIGLGVGLIAALARRALHVLDAVFDFGRSIPPVVLLPMFLRVFGWNDTARIATIAAANVWIMALSVTAAARTARSIRCEVLDVAGCNRLHALFWTQPWESLPLLVVGLRTGASMSLIVSVVTEMIAGTDAGIGARIIAAQISGDATSLTQAILAVGLAGYAANRLLRAIEDRVRLD